MLIDLDKCICFIQTKFINMDCHVYYCLHMLCKQVICLKSQLPILYNLQYKHHVPHIRSCLNIMPQICCRIKSILCADIVQIWCRHDATVWYFDSLFGRRRVFRSREKKLNPGGMTLPQLVLWDKGRWAWGRISSSTQRLVRTRLLNLRAAVICKLLLEQDGCRKTENSCWVDHPRETKCF